MSIKNRVHDEINVSNGLELIFNFLLEPILIFDITDMIIKINQAAIEWFVFNPVGLDKTEITQKTYPDLFKQALVNELYLLLDKVKSSGAFEENTVVLQKNRKKKTKYVLYAFPVLQNRAVIGAIVTWHKAEDAGNYEKGEISLKANHEFEVQIKRADFKFSEALAKLKKKSDDLQKSDAKLFEQRTIVERIFNNTHFLIAYMDRDYNFIRVNNEYALSDGRPVDFFTGKNHFDLYPDEENKKIFDNVVESGEPFITFAKPFTYPDRPDGGVTYWDWSLQPVKNKHGNVDGLILMLLDVTERKKKENELFKTKMDLEEAKRLSDIGTLAATVAHELRNPLGVIQTAVYNIRRKNEQEKLQKHIVHIEKKIAESERIINNLLNYSRMKKPQPKMIHLYNFMEECIDTIKIQYRNVEVKLKKNYNVFKNVKVNMDPFQIREVVTNILNNAYQALREDGGRIRIKGEIADANELIIEISDNGEGIDERDLSQIFSPFFTRKSKGTGLGLTISRELLNLNNGSINVHSTRGEGTTVRITLPLTEGGRENE